MAKKKQALNNDRPLSIEEAYSSRPRLWWIYTLIILIVAALLGWSGTSITYKGLANKGITIAQGIGYGLLHPDTNLLFNLTNEGVPCVPKTVVECFECRVRTFCARSPQTSRRDWGGTITVGIVASVGGRVATVP